MQRIYLDNAATSWPKPESVYQAVDSYQRNLGAPAGRGVYEAAREVDRRLERARWLLSQLIDASDWRQIVFTYSGTDALTLALQGTLRPGDHVITSVYEHSSVLRPLRYWESQGKIHVTRISGDSSGQIHADQIKTALTDKTRLVALTHASNVTGTLQPLAEIGQLLASHPALFLVDAAQTVGHLPVSVRQLQCDFLAAPAHKGLLAPTGTGFLYIAPDRQSCLEPARLGGTGTFSESDEQPTEMPGRYEAGNHNVPGLLGLEAALQFLQQHAVDQVAHHGQLLGQQVYQGLASMAHVVVYGPDRSQPTAPLLSFNLKNLAPQETVILLNEIAGIEARAGFHCAPRMHATLQTSELGGTVRVSWGVFSKSSDIEALLEAVESLAG